MTFENVLFALITVFLVFLGWLLIRTHGKRPNASLDVIRDLAADSESTRARDWRELGDEICAQVFPGDDPVELKDIFARYHVKLSKDHGFGHDAPADVVADVVRRLYPSREPEVWSILRKYDRPVLGVQIPRVQLDILKASGGRFDALAPLAKQANDDVRELLAIAESPNAMRVLSQALTSPAGDFRELRRHALDEDLREFVAWHRSLPASAHSPPSV